MNLFLKPLKNSLEYYAGKHFDACETTVHSYLIPVIGYKLKLKITNRRN